MDTHALTDPMGVPLGQVILIYLGAFAVIVAVGATANQIGKVTQRATSTPEAAGESTPSILRFGGLYEPHAYRNWGGDGPKEYPAAEVVEAPDATLDRWFEASETKPPRPRWKE